MASKTTVMIRHASRLQWQARGRNNHGVILLWQDVQQGPCTHQELEARSGSLLSPRDPPITKKAQVIVGGAFRKIDARSRAVEHSDSCPDM